MTTEPATLHLRRLSHVVHAPLPSLAPSLPLNFSRILHRWYLWKSHAPSRSSFELPPDDEDGRGEGGRGRGDGDGPPPLLPVAPCVVTAPDSLSMHDHVFLAVVAQHHSLRPRLFLIILQQLAAPPARDKER